jgi:hypothetical protein
MPIMPGRYTAEIDQPFVVFLIGMRVNRVFALRRWLPAAMAMTPMLQTLFTQPEKGFLGGEFFVYWRGVMVTQYWRSFADLETFARNPADPHLGAWRRFNQSVGSDGSVGVWHETYLVEPGRYEAVYVNMPVFGLAKSTHHVPAIGRRETARRRLGGESEPAVASPSTIVG